MLTHPTSERLRALGLVAMAQALEEQRRQPDLDGLGFEERLALLVEREATGREDRRLRARLKFAGLRQSACIEDVDWRAARGLDRAMFQRLASGEWIDRHQGVLLTGPTGVGKTWLACALGHKACRDGRSVLYQRLPRLLEALALARGDGRYARMLKGLARVQAWDVSASWRGRVSEGAQLALTALATPSCAAFESGAATMIATTAAMIADRNSVL